MAALSGGEPVALGVVAACAAFEARDHRRPDAEVFCDGGEGEVLGLAVRALTADRAALWRALIPLSASSLGMTDARPDSAARATA